MTPASSARRLRDAAHSGSGLSRGRIPIMIVLALLWSFAVSSPARCAERGPDPLAELRAEAAKGIASAQVKLGLCHQYGKGATENQPEAVSWYEKAAAQDNPDGQLMLALACQSGTGIERDPARALTLLKKASDAGHPMGMTGYGEQLIASDPVTAFAYMKTGFDRLMETDPDSGSKFFKQVKTLGEQLGEKNLARGLELAAEIEAKTPEIVTLIGHKFPLGPKSLTQEQVEALMKEVLPKVEEAAGRAFKRLPIVKIGSRQQVAFSLADDIYPQLRNLMPHQPEQDARIAALNQGFSMGPALLGKYGFTDKTLYILIRNLGPLMDRIGIDQQLTPTLLKVLMAHELTHALQDQHLDLPATLASMTDQEALSAFNATIEGHAVFVQDSVGTALMLDKEVMEFARFLSAGISPNTDPAQAIQQKIARARFEETYIGGREFVSAICRIHGRSRLWDMLESPPTRTSMISLPETYTFGRQKERVDFSPVLAGMETRFGGGPWETQQVELGAMALKASYANMNPEKLAALLPTFGGVRSLVFRHPKAAESNTLSLFVMRDPGAVHDLVSSLEEMARENLKKIDAGSQIVVKDIQFADLVVPGADLARRISFRIGVSEDALIRQSFYRIGYRSILVEITDSHLNMPEPRVIEIAGEVRDRFAEFARKHAARKAGQGNATAKAQTPPPGARAAATPEDARDAGDLKAATGHFKRQDFPAARQCLRQLLQRRPDHAQGRFLMAVMAAKDKDYSQAWKHIEIARRVDPANQKIADFVKRLQEVSPAVR